MTHQRAVLFADRIGHEIAPLNEHYPVCLLPIAGKSALEFWFESLCEMGVQHVDIIVSRFSDQIKAKFSNGDHWGLTIAYHLSTGEEEPTQLLKRTHDLNNHVQFLAARGDVLPSFSTDGKINNLLSIRDINDAELNQLSWTDKQQVQPSDLTSLTDYKESVFNVLALNLNQLTPRGLQASDCKWLASPSFSATRAEHIEGHLYIGRDAVADRTASLSNSVIESGSMIDKNAHVSNAIIFPGTYVGQDTTLNNVIVDGSLLIDLTHGTTQQISDPALLSKIVPSSTLVKTTTRERLVAAFLIILTSPIALLLAFISKKGQLLNRTAAPSNRGSRLHPMEFERLTFSSRFAWVRAWPGLINVMDGDLKLFGSSEEQFDQEQPLPNLPYAQGLFTPLNVFKRKEFDEMELQLWGLELASEKHGALSLLTKTVKISLKNLI